MKYIFVLFIKFYQRFVSPYKGFHCAHHVMHGGDTCSNAVKRLILNYGFLKALPLVRHRFNECRLAHDDLQKVIMPSHRADLPCDLPCDISFGDCGGESAESACNVVSFCDWPFGSRDFSKRTKNFLLVASFTLILVLSYVFYGRQIGAVYVTDLGQSNQGLMARLVQREYPEVRVLLLVDGQKHYSNIRKLSEAGVEVKFTLKKSVSSFDIDRLEILDARLNVANSLVVVGQVLEKIDQPPKQGVGQRFSYRLKRRWHF